VQYVSIKYTERLAAAGIEPLVGSVGDSYDNALADALLDVRLSASLRPQPADSDDVQCAVGGPVATPV